jgi:adhesin HecA-like repeat protein
MNRKSPLIARVWFVPLLIGAAACGSGDSSSNTFTGDDGGAGDNDAGGSSDASFANDGPTFGTPAIDSITISPATASIESLNNAPATQAFQLTAHYVDNTSGVIASGAAWTATAFPVGTVDGAGLYTANGSQGGLVTVTASYKGKTAAAQLTVKLHLLGNTGNVGGAQQGTLKGATTPDPTVKWAYPYDGTVFPRGLLGPELQWTGAGATDAYYVHLTSPTFELEDFMTAANARYNFVSAAWQQFTASTSGAASLKVNRLVSGASSATVIGNQKYTIAPASMRGTIYYWAINTGRIMRIKPGAQADDMFQPSGVACPSCHTVSANGSRLAMNTGNWPNETSVTYDLQGNQNAYAGLSVSSGASPFALGALSANGKVLVENFAPLRGPIGTVQGAFNVATGQQIASTGLEGTALWMPAFAPDDKLLAYVTSNGNNWGGDLHAFDWDATAQKATNDRLIMGAGANTSINVINSPTVSPDHQWILYQRSNGPGSLGNAADLYMASVAQPSTETALAALNGAAYPFAAGSRDQHLNFEPTFAPVAAGGYFWVVFHSRRTYGNELTGAAFVQEGQGTKQLWVAAIDQNPTPGQDPSHPAFWLPGQDLTTLNMRGYWALDPCKGDGQGCQSGTECCGGYCKLPQSADAGGPVCASQSAGCANNGDHCTQTSDCCGAATGVTCINSVCSEPPPK